MKPPYSFGFDIVESLRKDIEDNDPFFDRFETDIVLHALKNKVVIAALDVVNQRLLPEGITPALGATLIEIYAEGEEATYCGLHIATPDDYHVFPIGFDLAKTSAHFNSLRFSVDAPPPYTNNTKIDIHHVYMVDKATKILANAHTYVGMQFACSKEDFRFA